MEVLDKGYVKLVRHMGTEKSIVDAARISVGAKSKAKRTDEELLEFLYVNGHMSPFEHVHFTFKVKAPIFVLRQWMRHRTWNYSELSMRYTESDGEYYMPKDWEDSWEMDIMSESMYESVRSYKWVIDHDIPRETARGVLPQSMYSEVIMTVDLNNLLKFFKLRNSEHAQSEIRAYAKEMEKLVWPLIPNVMEVYKQERWVDEKLSSQKSKLRKHWKDELSLMPRNILASVDRLSTTESKNSESESEKGITPESSGEDANVQKSTPDSSNIMDLLCRATSPVLLRFLVSNQKL